jgi:hypothetical protein
MVARVAYLGILVFWDVRRVSCRNGSWKSWPLKRKALRSLEKLENIQQIMQRHIPKEVNP